MGETPVGVLDLSGQLMLPNGPGGLSAGPFDATLGTTLGVDQSEPVLVTLDRAIPAGPWDASITLRSGTTERQATATVTFPDAIETSSEPVPTDTAGESRVVPILVAVAVLVILLVVILLLIRRRRPATATSTAP